MNIAARQLGTALVLFFAVQHMKVVLENRPEQDCYYDRTKYYLPNIPNA
jgi:hypothetical protein